MGRIFADLHLHSSMSDGAISPEQVANKVKEAELMAFSLTDHDTTDGIKAAGEVADSLGLKFIAGVEISCIFEGEDIHILGYGMDISDSNLVKTLELFRNERRGRFKKMLEVLCKYGLSMDDEAERVLKHISVPGRMHAADLLIAQGIVKSRREAFDKFLGHGRPACLPKYRMSMTEAVKLIRGAGGSPVLAHPGMYTRPLEIVESALKSGVVGIEAFHPSNNFSLEKRLVEIAEERGVLITGGSDSHFSTSDEGRFVGVKGVSEDIFEKLVSFILN